jgi:hypothetical protein
LQKELTKEAILDGQKTATENAQTLGLSIVPIRIGQSTLDCVSTYENPSPYERCWFSGSKNIENNFTVLVDMNYAFKKDSKNPSSEQESAEKDDSKSNAQG